MTKRGATARQAQWVERAVDSKGDQAVFRVAKT
jgi:hypothetical protein